MPRIDLSLAGEGCWPDLAAKSEAGRVIDLMGDAAPPIRIALLCGGMASGAPSVTFRLDLPDGRSLLTETSLGLLETAVTAMRAADRRRTESN